MNVRKIRGIADGLFEQGKYEDAYYIYDEIYNQIWSAIGLIQTGMNEFSQTFLGNSFKANYDLKNNFTVQAANNLFKKWFDLDTDQTLNEFTFVTYSHLQCICYSPVLNTAISADAVYSEVLVLHSLILNSEQDDWISPLTKLITPTMEDKRIKKIRSVVTEASMKKSIIENASKLKSTDWSNLNYVFLDYLINVGDNSSELYTSVHKIVGIHTGQKSHRKKYYKTKEEQKQKQSGFKYQSYERYEKHEFYERYESYTSDTREFDPTSATEFEKSKYYGEVLGLSGKISKSYIRKKYLDLIAKYHPDKVFELGDELKVLAEIKTKKINAAYEWMKKKYNI